MNTAALTYFLETCRCGSFSEAAEKLYLSPQGISKAVKTMEEELGCPLFLRTPGGVKLTEQGLLVRMYAERIMAEVNQMQAELSRISGTSSRRGCLGITMGASEVVGKEKIAQIQALASQAGMSWVDSVDLLCEEEVLNGTYDMAITAGPVDGNKFAVKLLRKGPLCAFVHKSHPFYERESIGYSDLKNQRLITTNSNFKTYHQLTEACRYYGFEPDIAATTITLRDTCRSYPDRTAVGISTYLILGKIKYQDFRAVPIADERYGWELVLISQKGRRLSEVQNELCRKVLNCAYEKI